MMVGMRANGGDKVQRARFLWGSSKRTAIVLPPLVVSSSAARGVLFIWRMATAYAGMAAHSPGTVFTAFGRRMRRGVS